jgi:arsenite oxidase small subunit
MAKKLIEQVCVTRRQFLLAGGGAAVTTGLLLSIPGLASAVPAKMSRYPEKTIAKLSRLGVPAGGGVGPDKDIVAFSSLCTHMGGPMMGAYKPEHKAVGPCPFHLTSFDLTKHGMVIAGHATESLPQVILEARGNDIVAVGILGLVYGRYDNLRR